MENMQQQKQQRAVKPIRPCDNIDRTTMTNQKRTMSSQNNTLGANNNTLRTNNNTLRMNNNAMASNRTTLKNMTSDTLSRNSDAYKQSSSNTYKNRQQTYNNGLTEHQNSTNNQRRVQSEQRQEEGIQRQVQQVQRQTQQEHRQVQSEHLKNRNINQRNESNSIVNSVDRPIEGLDDTLTTSSVRPRRMTRLQRRANGVPEIRPVEQSTGKEDLLEQRDYYLKNDNKEAFKIKRIKRQSFGFMVLPLLVLITLLLITVSIIGSALVRAKNMKINTVSLLNSEPITKEEFVSASENSGLTVEEKEVDSGIHETTSYADKYKYEINFITFDSAEDTLAYYNYIIDEADEVKSSVSSSVVGHNSAESTLISSTYNGFMDITYIDNTIMIAIAYDSNEQTSVINFMNSLGY